MSSETFVQVCVGGMPYSIAVSDIEKHPGSFFECMIKKEWMDNQNDDVIKIERDGALFKYVNAFLVVGHLPRDEHGQITFDQATLDGLKEEADFFGLKDLEKECVTVHKTIKDPDVLSYMTIRKYLSVFSKIYGGEESRLIDYTSPVIGAIQCVWAPATVSGTLYKLSHDLLALSLFKTSTIFQLNIPELIAAASQSAFGRGTHSIVDASVRKSFEIPASQCNPLTLRLLVQGCDIRHLARHMELELRPYKLVIYQTGGHFDEHRDSVRGEGHIGTLVIILNSDYTGGELEVTHGGRTETVTGAYSWVAMYGDCLHKIHPVTSGTRVSLIYDIYGTPFTFPAAKRTMPPIPTTKRRPARATYILHNGAWQLADTIAEEEVEDPEAGPNAIQEAFWEHQTPYERRTEPVQEVAPECLRPVSTAERSLIFESLDKELIEWDCVILTLAHLYPECQTSPAFLKGGDRALHDLLSKHFGVHVVAATVLHCADFFEPEETWRQTSYGLFSSAHIQARIEESEELERRRAMFHGSPPPKERKVQRERAKLLIAHQPSEEGVLDYDPFIPQVGNEPQPEETVYLVAGLQVRKK